jgi:hypothetical protein
MGDVVMGEILSSLIADRPRSQVCACRSRGAKRFAKPFGFGSLMRVQCAFVAATSAAMSGAGGATGAAYARAFASAARAVKLSSAVIWIGAAKQDAESTAMVVSVETFIGSTSFSMERAADQSVLLYRQKNSTPCALGWNSP